MRGVLLVLLATLQLASQASIASSTGTGPLIGFGEQSPLALSRLSLMEARYDLPRGLLRAICQVETRCNVSVKPQKEPRRSDKAYGPWQIRQIALAELRRVGLLPRIMSSIISINSMPTTHQAHIAALYTTYLLTKCSSLSAAMSAWNTGRCHQMTSFSRKVEREMPYAPKMPVLPEYGYTRKAVRVDMQLLQ
jgi:hypothetical protein